MSVPRLTTLRRGRTSVSWRVDAHEAVRNTGLVVTAIVLVVMTVLLVPVQDLAVPASSAFLPVVLVAIGLLFGISAHLLIADFTDYGDLRLLMSAGAYLAALVVLVGCALAAPGGFAAHPPLASTPEVGDQLWLTAAVALTMLLGLAWAPWAAARLATPPPERRASLVVLVLTVVPVIAAFSVAGVVVAASRIEVASHPMLLPVAGAGLVLVVTVSMVAVLRGTVRRPGPERWTSLVAFASLGDVTLGMGAPAGTSVGWYAGHSLLLVGASAFVLAWIADARRIKSQAERDSAFDPLTGLPNRRSGHQTLEHTAAQARRSGVPLALLLVDLDDFHRINDQYGYEAGDATVAAVGRLLVAACRTGDIVARVGGEEFLVLLPDTRDRGALIVADKIRSAVALEPIAPIGVPLTVSIGATTLQIHDLDPNEMLRRASAALSRAKATGYNRIILLAGMTDDDLLGAL